MRCCRLFVAFCCVFALLRSPLSAQDRTLLAPLLPQWQNPSFNGTPQESAPFLTGWFPLDERSTPDILPGPWGVTTPALEGSTYVGLTTRSDHTWEAIFQPLDNPLMRGYCYKFSVYLARSASYVGYNQPTRLRVWGSNDPHSLQNAQLLCSTAPIEHTTWQRYELSFTAQQEWRYIVLECYYKEQTLLPYRGNLLIDLLSAFLACDRA